MEEKLPLISKVCFTSAKFLLLLGFEITHIADIFTPSNSACGLLIRNYGSGNTGINQFGSFDIIELPKSTKFMIVYQFLKCEQNVVR